MARVPIRGVTGRVVVGPDVAAELGTWAVAVADETMGDDGWTCTAEVRRRDDYLIAHGQRFGLKLDFGDARLCWAEVAVADGDRMVIKGRGAPEVRG